MYMIFRLISALVPKNNKAIRGVLMLAFPLSTIFLTKFMVVFIENQIFITGSILYMMEYFYWAINLMAMLCAVIMVGTMLLEILLWNRYLDSHSFDTYLLRFDVRITSIAVCIFITVHSLSNLGIPLATILTGAGVTGLAVALVAQELLRNIFGSMMLILDKPFKVGQRIKVRGNAGIV